MMKNITTMPRFELPSDHRIGRAGTKIPRKTKYRNFTCKNKRGRWMIIPKSSIGKANETLKAKLGNLGKV